MATVSTPRPPARAARSRSLAGIAPAISCAAILPPRWSRADADRPRLGHLTTRTSSAPRGSTTRSRSRAPATIPGRWSTTRRSTASRPNAPTISPPISPTRLKLRAPSAALSYAAATAARRSLRGMPSRRRCRRKPFYAGVMLFAHDPAAMTRRVRLFPAAAAKTRPLEILGQRARQDENSGRQFQPAAGRGDRRLSRRAADRLPCAPLRRPGDFRRDSGERARARRLHHPVDVLSRRTTI